MVLIKYINFNYFTQQSSSMQRYPSDNAWIYASTLEKPIN